MKLAILIFVGALGCEVPTTTVVLQNTYLSTLDAPLIYQGFWQAVRFSTPVVPGASSDPQVTVPASANTAYVVLAPGWNSTDPEPPTTFVVLQSQTGFAVALDSALNIAVDDTTFVGNCATGSHLDQDQADFITQRVFQAVFEGLTYDAASCAVTVSR